jgi:hypothetical protein
MSLKAHTKIITKGPSFEARTSADIDDTVIILRVNQLTPESFEELKEGVAIHLERIKKLGISKYKEIITEPKPENPEIPSGFVFVHHYVTASGEYDLYLHPIMADPVSWDEISLQRTDFPAMECSLPNPYEMMDCINQYRVIHQLQKDDFKPTQFLWCRDKTLVLADRPNAMPTIMDFESELKCNYFRVLRVHK